jgi:hypothetical protein
VPLQPGAVRGAAMAFAAPPALLLRLLQHIVWLAVYPNAHLDVVLANCSMPCRPTLLHQASASGERRIDDKPHAGWDMTTHAPLLSYIRASGCWASA